MERVLTPIDVLGNLVKNPFCWAHHAILAIYILDPDFMSLGLRALYSITWKWENDGRSSV